MEYRLERQLAVAFGHPTTTGKRPRFVVKAGSTAMRNGSPSVRREEATRDRLVRDGVLVPDTNPALYRFSQDFEFSSASAAGGVVNDGNMSAPQYWINTSTGATLKEDLTLLT